MPNLDDDPDAPAGTSSRHLDDDAYHEYLWGESSPRSFAQRAKIGGTKNRRGSRVVVRYPENLDVSGFVPR